MCQLPVSETVRPSRPTSMASPELRALTTGLVLTVTLVALEALAVATVMPVVSADLGGISLYGWVFSAFFLGDLVGIVAAGEQADRHGLVRPYLLGLGFFAVGLTVGGLAPSMPVLVAARAVQGFGAGAIPAVAYVSIGRQYPPGLRPRMFAIMSTAWVAPGIAGPALAGVIAAHLTWRAVFLGLLPLVAVAGALTVPSLAAVPGAQGVGGAMDAAPAVPGVAGAGIAQEAEAARLGEADPAPGRGDARGLDAERGMRPGRLIDALRVAVGAGLLLAALDAHQALPLVGLGAAGLVVGLPALQRLLPGGSLRAHTGLPAAVLLRGVLTFGFTGAEAFVPLMLVALRGMSAAQAGLALTAATVTWAVGSWIQARRIAGWGVARLIRLGLVLVVGGIGLVALTTAAPVPVAVGVTAWGIAGLGMGIAYSPISLFVLHEAPAGREGAATAGLQLSDVLGTALGAGVGGVALATAPGLGWGEAAALLLTFGIAGAAVLAGLAVTARLGPAAAPGPGLAGHG